MPPKKKQEQADQPVLLGRLGTNLKCGIVGLPNVGCVFSLNYAEILLSNSEIFLLLGIIVIQVKLHFV